MLWAIAARLAACVSFFFELPTSLSRIIRGDTRHLPTYLPTPERRIRLDLPTYPLTPLVKRSYCVISGWTPDRRGPDAAGDDVGRAGGHNGRQRQRREGVRQHEW